MNFKLITFSKQYGLFLVGILTVSFKMERKQKGYLHELQEGPVKQPVHIHDVDVQSGDITHTPTLLQGLFVWHRSIPKDIKAP